MIPRFVYGDGWAARYSVGQWLHTGRTICNFYRTDSQRLIIEGIMFSADGEEPNPAFFAYATQYALEGPQ